MPRNINLPANWPPNWKGSSIRDPRLLMRGLIGLLLLANLVMAVIAFKPFGGSADDLRRQQAALESQLVNLQKRVDASRKLVERVNIAREQGDQFLSKYFLDERTLSSQFDEEMLKDAKDSGIKQLPATYERIAIEGSDTLEMVTITQGLEGTYENLTKFINLLDKSKLLLIVDSMETTAPQQNGKQLSVQLKIRTFARAEGGPVS